MFELLEEFLKYFTINPRSTLGISKTKTFFNQKYLKKFTHSSATLPTGRYPLIFYS
nr:MAG TPA: hypothetical protein [Caudoviricetes sp.]